MIKIDPTQYNQSKYKNILRQTKMSTNKFYHGKKPHEQASKKKPLSFKNFTLLLMGLATALGGLICYAKNRKKPSNVFDSLPVDVSKKLKNIVVTGVDEVKAITSKLTNADYDSTKNFRANLHIHSNLSDGKLSPIEILNQAVELGNKLPDDEKFIFSLTDHDSIDGAREIVEEIAKNPDKYSKIKFIPGIELSTKYHNRKITLKPVEMDFLIYGFDVNDSKILQETSRRKKYLADTTSAFFDDINKKWPELSLSVSKMQQECQNNTVRNMCSNGYLKALKAWVKELLGDKYDKIFVNRLLSNHFNDPRFAYNANLDLESAINLTKELNAFSSLAHPGKFNFQNAEVMSSHINLAKDIFDLFISKGGNGIESHYMSYEPEKSWWPKVRTALKSLNLNYERTGGYDTHGLKITQKN